MNRTLKCTKFELSRLLTSMGVFLGIYIAAYLLMMILFANTSGNSGTTNMNLCFAAGIFITVVLMATYKNFYNNLMMFGNTRQSIINSMFIISAMISVTFAILSLLSEYLNTWLGKILAFSTSSLLNMIYGRVNDFEKLLFFMTMLLALCTFALLYGALEYKIGRIFKVIFWVAFGFLWMLIPIIQRLNIVTQVVNALKWYFGYRMSNGILHVSLHFFVTAVILGGITYLIARRQPQDA